MEESALSSLIDENSTRMDTIEMKNDIYPKGKEQNRRRDKDRSELLYLGNLKHDLRVANLGDQRNGM